MPRFKIWHILTVTIIAAFWFTIFKIALLAQQNSFTDIWEIYTRSAMIASFNTLLAALIAIWPLLVYFENKNKHKNKLKELEEYPDMIDWM